MHGRASVLEGIPRGALNQYREHPELHLTVDANHTRLRYVKRDAILLWQKRMDAIAKAPHDEPVYEEMVQQATALLAELAGLPR